MLKEGGEVGLRARHEDDIPILHAELYDDVVTHSRAVDRPWRPITPGSKDSQFAVDDKEQVHAPFSVVELVGGALVGTAVLSNIDNHNRSAHIGLGLLPSSHGKGYGTDVVAVHGQVVHDPSRMSAPPPPCLGGALRSPPSPGAHTRCRTSCHPRSRRGAL